MPASRYENLTQKPAIFGNQLRIDAEISGSLQPFMTEFRVENGPSPQTQLSGDFTEMAGQLRQVLRTLLKRDGLRPEQVVVLAPYRHTNATSGWAAGLDEVTLNLDVVNAVPGQVRIGTIQGFWTSSQARAKGSP